MRRIALALALLTLLAASCGDDAGPGARDLSATSDPGIVSLGAEDATSSSTEGETTTTSEEATTTSAPTEPCPLPQPLPRGANLGPDMVSLHRAVTAFAESARALGTSLQAAPGFAPGWGAREPVASPFYRMQADLYSLALRLERAYAAAGATYSPGSGWTFPEGPYPLAALAEPWGQIPEFQAVTLTAFFEQGRRRDALADFEQGGICRLVAAFSTAIDRAVAESEG